MGESGDSRYNLRCPSVKRLMREAKELQEPTDQYHAQPLEDNLYEWHFTIRGGSDTDFAQGVYHGRIMLPPDYPMKPPSIMLLTPNGRFEVNKKICLSISGHHPESWQPSWSIRTALMAIIGFLPTPGKGAIGALDYPPEERKKLAKRSKDWRCSVCDCPNETILKTVSTSSSVPSQDSQNLQELASQISFKAEAQPTASGDMPSPIGAAPGSEDSASNKTALVSQLGDSNGDSQSAECPTPPAAPLTPAFTPSETTDSTDGIRRRIVIEDEIWGEDGAGDNLQQARRIETSSSFYLMVLVSVAIGVLLLRRLVRNFDVLSDLL